jgi:hypothetical protein
MIAQHIRTKVLHQAVAESGAQRTHAWSDAISRHAGFVSRCSDAEGWSPEKQRLINQ